MKILISGICGFVGSSLARALREAESSFSVCGFDNFIRPGSETNRLALRKIGVRVFHADVRCPSDFETLPDADWVIDAAANPSVLAGADGQSSSRQLLEHNLAGTINLLEYCKARKAGFILLSTSRVYSIPALAQLPVIERKGAFTLRPGGRRIPGAGLQGVAEDFDTSPPLSLYGTTKRASELLALEYSGLFGFPAWVNRCGVLAGPGQFGRIDQGIFSFWIHSWKAGRPLSYLGFGGHGHQVRDCLHPLDLAPTLLRQMKRGAAKNLPRIINLSGGRANAMSLRQLSAWCAERFGPREITAQKATRSFDIPWLVLDSRLAEKTWGFAPSRPLPVILEEIARHAELHPGWLDQTSA